MLRGFPLVLILLAGVPAAHAEGARHRFGQVDPNAPPITADSVREKGAVAFACSRSAAEVQARTTREAESVITASAWAACSDRWAEAAFEFAGAGQAINRDPAGLDPALNAFGKAADLLRADWTARAPAIIAQARRAGPSL